MINDTDLKTQMFGQQGQLGNFGTRIRFAYLFGIIDRATYRELGIIGDIRNHFAHRTDAHDFKFPKIQGAVSSMAIFNDPLFPHRYLALAGAAPPGLTPAEAVARWRKQLRESGYDLSEPKWAFMGEVAIFCVCFKAALPNPKLMPMLIAPLI